jgi:uncharacterized damage-inducible protein DinB
MEASMIAWPVQLLFAAWKDLDTALRPITTEQAVAQLAGGSSFAWTLGHVTYEVDAWINVRFQGLPPHPIGSDHRFRVGGTGAANNWSEIQQATHEVRSTARNFLSECSDVDLQRVIPYDGSYGPFRANGMQLRAAVLQIARHHTYHLGEIVTKLDLIGVAHAEFPLPVIDDPGR